MVMPKGMLKYIFRKRRFVPYFMEHLTWHKKNATCFKFLFHWTHQEFAWGKDEKCPRRTSVDMMPTEKEMSRPISVPCHYLHLWSGEKEQKADPAPYLPFRLHQWPEQEPWQHPWQKHPVPRLSPAPPVIVLKHVTTTFAGTGKALSTLIHRPSYITSKTARIYLLPSWQQDTDFVNECINEANSTTCPQRSFCKKSSDAFWY